MDIRTIAGIYVATERNITKPNAGGYYASAKTRAQVIAKIIALLASDNK
jgi:hypothetical protein